MTRRVKRLGPPAVALATLIGVAGCDGDNAEVDLQQREQSAATDVSFTGCDEAKCTGEIDGAAYEIRMPDT